MSGDSAYLLDRKLVPRLREVPLLPLADPKAGASLSGSSWTLAGAGRRTRPPSSCSKTSASTRGRRRSFPTLFPQLKPSIIGVHRQASLRRSVVRGLELVEMGRKRKSHTASGKPSTSLRLGTGRGLSRSPRVKEGVIELGDGKESDDDAGKDFEAFQVRPRPSSLGLVKRREVQSPNLMNASMGKLYANGQPPKKKAKSQATANPFASEFPVPTLSLSIGSNLPTLESAGTRIDHQFVLERSSKTFADIGGCEAQKLVRQGLSQG